MRRRNLLIMLDVASGVPAAEIAEREDVCLQRVYQIVNATLRKVGATKSTPKEHLGLLCFRYAQPCPRRDTPEAFYWEELAHNQGETYGF